MTRNIILVALLCAAGSVAMAQGFSLDVMSFNLRNGEADDGDNSWRFRKDLVVDTIQRYSPDIVGTQECFAFQAEYIAAGLREYRSFGMGRDADGTGERMEVFYKKDVLSPIESGNFWLSKTPGVPGSNNWQSACNRMVTWARFYHHETKRFFYYFNTHFDHRSEEARQEGAKLMVKRINQVPTGAPVIVTGDFNQKGGDSAVWATLISGGLKDTWQTAEKTVGPPITSSRFGPPREGIDRRIDWILTRGPIKAALCETVLYNQDGRYPSDHYPVFAKLEVGE